MNLFIIGDVHGCFYTFSEMLKRWDPATDYLIQVGDLVDRGAHIPETVELARQLNEQYPESTTFLMGNHEDALLHHFSPQGPYPGWLNWGGRSTTDQYKRQPKLLTRHLPWLEQRPLLWQNDHVLVSHAGLADIPLELALDRDSPDGILWRRGPLRRLPQLQVVGHTPMDDGEPIHDPDSHTMYIDTGAVFGRNLTALRLSPTGDVLDIIMLPVNPDDLPDKSRYSHLTPR
ncbi:serine/threonine protein phosphatase [Microvirga sp. STS02]|uniref:metallophosphoesterase family protein n=1 Tax=Hymenobacter negativus TaxID=2795026 RepID=UPI0018DB06B4|nr:MULTISPECIES: metallophosphoesterase family protein [Bacteria]MBH8571027.1 serine/threonine protein phosphatase [Hymenobacter negativus]MBR7210764.1 serine/threonine protein phosphatase [Microvirga sp. STS02]